MKVFQKNREAYYLLEQYISFTHDQSANKEAIYIYILNNGRIMILFALFVFALKVKI